MSRLTRCDEYGYAKLNFGCSFDDVIDRLAYYEDLEEQGVLIELPCKIGDAVWEIVQLPYLFPDEMDDLYIINRKEFELNDLNDINKYVFLTEKEARTRLTELEG